MRCIRGIVEKFFMAVVLSKVVVLRFGEILLPCRIEKSFEKSRKGRMKTVYQ
jgi:hypothetical protein